ncbi:hypothetical protein F5Y18DRAFT_378675 [Xylariaceae sp. FL1019]|nr:hypothetical protein F5Y18DRAFT_378675 [Xylariaceae sp. FL1019]
MYLHALILIDFFSSCVLGYRLSAANTSASSVNVKWLEGVPILNNGATFGLPWPKGKYPADAVSFAASDESGNDVALQSWVTAYWADGSLKWTGHAVPGSEVAPDSYQIIATNTNGNNKTSTTSRRAISKRTIQVESTDDEITVDTGKVTATFPTSGDVLVSSITSPNGNVVGKNGRLILRSQSGVADDEDTIGAGIESFIFASVINETVVDSESSVRMLVTVRGNHKLSSSTNSSSSHASWLPFILRFYFYADSDTIKIIHTLIFDGEAEHDFITGIGLRFDVPLADEELYDRHVRIAGVNGGFLNEAVQGITGLRRDPGAEVRAAQYNGTKTPDISTWDTRVSSRMQWIPSWNDYRLTQLSPDGFALSKRTKAGQGWVKIPGATRAGGLAYLGGATKGGLAVALRHFWKRYPTSLDISNAASDSGQITLWLYSPSAEPLDMRQFHDGLGEDTYAKQSDALEITYEDYEDGWDTPHGIATTNEIFIRAFDATPPAEDLAALTSFVENPPVLVPEPAYIKETEALGTYWDLPGSSNSTEAAQTIESHLDFLMSFYQDQVEQRRWYGFWDHGDIMHTYDEDRHTWRYDVGGFAWDNSELSPNLFFWNQFLRTGQADVYRFSEAHMRHTSEVDVYHLGEFNGFGTRHGVQHWGDSSKQIRVSTPLFNQIFYYISGGDERVGEIMHELMDADKAFLKIDVRRKVRDPNITYIPEPTAIDIDLGLDFGGMASVWLIEWERRGPRWQEAKSKLNESMQGIASLKYGFVTGLGSYNLYTGAISAPNTNPNNSGIVGIEHLGASFGLPEIIAQIELYMGDDYPENFNKAWREYCYYYGASAEEQIARYGSAFTSLSLFQGHSRLTAYLAKVTGNATLAARAWNEIFNIDGLSSTEPWTSALVNGSQVLNPVDEAPWMATNDAAQYGLAAIENLAQIAYAL